MLLVWDLVNMYNLERVCHILTLLQPESSMFHKHMSLYLYIFIKSPPWNGTGALSVCFVRHSVLPSFLPSVPSKIVFSTPPTSLFSQLLPHPCMDLNETWYRCYTTSLEVHVWEIIHVQQILAELLPLTLRIFTHFSCSSQLLLNSCMGFNETMQGCRSTSLELHSCR